MIAAVDGFFGVFFYLSSLTAPMFLNDPIKVNNANHTTSTLNLDFGYLMNQGKKFKYLIPLIFIFFCRVDFSFASMRFLRSWRCFFFYQWDCFYYHPFFLLFRGKYLSSTWFLCSFQKKESFILMIFLSSIEIFTSFDPGFAWFSWDFSTFPWNLWLYQRNSR